MGIYPTGEVFPVREWKGPEPADHLNFAGPISRTLSVELKILDFVGKQADESANAKECVNCVTNT